jgi:hypothetical protein
MAVALRPEAAGFFLLFDLAAVSHEGERYEGDVTGGSW